MNLLNLGLVMLFPVLVAIYTFNYARWAWRQEYRRGAVGLFLLAGATAGIPGFVLWWNR